MNSLTVNMVAVQSSETPVSVFQSTGSNIIEYLNLQHGIFFISWMSSRSWSVPITKFPFHSFIDCGRFKEQYITWCLFSDSYSRLFFCIYERSNYCPLLCPIHFDPNGNVPLDTTQFAVWHCAIKSYAFYAPFFATPGIVTRLQAVRSEVRIAVGSRGFSLLQSV